jgi:hypothetical protein
LRRKRKKEKRPLSSGKARRLVKERGIGKATKERKKGTTMGNRNKDDKPNNKKIIKLTKIVGKTNMKYT